MVHAVDLLCLVHSPASLRCAHILDHSLTHTINQSINQSEEASTHSFTLTVKFAVLAALAWMDTHSPVKIDMRHALTHSIYVRVCMPHSLTVSEHDDSLTIHPCNHVNNHPHDLSFTHSP